MKKTEYTSPTAEMILLPKDDVMNTSSDFNQYDIGLNADDSSGLPTIGWKS